MHPCATNQPSPAQRLRFVNISIKATTDRLAGVIQSNSVPLRFGKCHGLGKVSSQFHCTAVPKRQRTGAVQNASRFNRRSERARAFGVRQSLPLYALRSPSDGSELGPPRSHQVSVWRLCQPPILQVALRQNAPAILAQVTAICRRKIYGTIEKVWGSLSGSIRCVVRTRSVRRRERDRFGSELYQRAKQFRKRRRTFGNRS
jgi:hypothetical protein